jgi:hypothetical protein
LIIYTAILGNYDSLKEPRIITPGWEYICFTDQDFKSKVWKIIKVEDGNSRLAARRIKILFHNYIDQENSIWVDGSFQINCNLNDWWQKHFKPDMTCIKHPVRDCVYDEARACIDLKKESAERIKEQMENMIIPPRSGLIQSGILMRQRTNFTIRICEQWWEELSKYTLRDQLSFAKVSYQQPINYITWDYRKRKEFLFQRHLKTTPIY